MRLPSLLCLALLVPGLVLAQAQTPVPQEPQPMMRSYRVYASSLEITPEGEQTTMLFSGGVRIEGRGLVLYTDSLELVLVGEALPLDGRLELTEGELPAALEERAEGEDLGEVARQLELPKASFHSDSVRRLKATGNVRFEGHGVVISTASVESRDGGLTWRGSGRTTLSMTDENGSTSLSADGLQLDTVSGIVTAEGRISGSYRQPGVPEPLLLETAGCSFDMNSGIVSVPGEMQLSYRGINMTISPQEGGQEQQSVATELDPLVPGLGQQPRMEPAPAGVSIDLQAHVVRARGSVHVADPERNIELDAMNLDYMMDEGLMKAWQVELSDIGHGMTLNAPLVEIFTNEKRLLASGMPVLKYRNSSYTGEQITVREESPELLVIEISGQQLATLHMDELRSFDEQEEDGGGGDLTITNEKTSEQ